MKSKGGRRRHQEPDKNVDILSPSSDGMSDALEAKLRKEPRNYEIISVKSKESL